ncbi:DUF262 domain-containing protein [Lentzea aerocolonigenes]|uniref:DUF262 domain-containing protein n=1 Tax=Lentzea aerocolonigenes TaxID=68170 RepID=UPI0004C42667|nr:DUF262 domain-containing protein [Lentzea aerocolonigenes]MCP2247011.1 Protein of unknown function (DUF1524) [Lentzea aerocolonigenes]
MQKLEAHEVPLHKVFGSDYDFRIPDYQRPYAWEVEQAQQLLDDLVEALDRDSDEPYFLGSMVLVKSDGAADSEVIDGQQRLTTLTILLAIVRDLANPGGIRDSLGKMIVEQGDELLGLEAKPRLALRKRDQAFFRSYVQMPGRIGELVALSDGALKTDAQKAIRDNAKALRDALVERDEEARHRLVKMISARTFLVVVSTPNLASAHRIFSVMNARGLDLSPADIFKSKVIGELDDEYATRWDEAEVMLGRNDFADLFLYIRMIFAKERAKQDLMTEFPKQVLNQYLHGREAEFVDDVLVPYAEAYLQIRDFGYAATEKAERINSWFRRLAQIDNSDWLPPALWAVRHHGDDPDWLDGFFRKLERLAASMFIRRIYTTPRVIRYANLLRDLAAGHGLGSAAFELDADERADTVRQLDGALYLVQKTRKYVLLRLDEMLADSSGVTHDFPIITVEHVLPQQPKEGSRWRDDFTAEERVVWTHRLANLVLLNRSKNSQARNYDFADKKAKYFLSGKGVAAFPLTSQVLAHTEWTPAMLETRQKELLRTLAEEWKL